MRSGCSEPGDGVANRNARSGHKERLTKYEFNYDYDAHLKQFMRQSFRLSPYARVEYPNQDAQGYASDEPLSPLEGEATAEWNPHVSYADAYVHAPWCRGACSHRCNPTGRAPDFERYRHDDYCRGGCGNKCARADEEGMKVVTMLLPGDIVAYGFRPADELDVPSPRYAPTDGETSGHCGDDDDDSLSTMTDGESAELTCLMADADPTDTKEPNSKFGWSILPDGTGVQVHVQGVHKATVTPDAVNRRFNAEFAADTGLNGSPAARAQMNAYMRKTEPESAEELARQLKEARKGYRSANSGSAGWRSWSNPITLSMPVMSLQLSSLRTGRCRQKLCRTCPLGNCSARLKARRQRFQFSLTPAPTAQWLQRIR